VLCYKIIFTRFIVSIPAVCLLENRQKIMGEAVFLITLYELAYPNKQAEVARAMGLSISSGQPLVSRIISQGINRMLGRWIHLIQSEGDNHDALAMWQDSAAHIVDCVRTKFEGLAHPRFDCSGMFIDGTFIFCCKPDQREEHSAQNRDTQRAVYSGYYGGDRFFNLMHLFAFTIVQGMASSICTVYGAMESLHRFMDPRMEGAMMPICLCYPS
jgi:hypothetical protein